MKQRKRYDGLSGRPFRFKTNDMRERLMSLVTIVGQCWEWQGYRSHGYGHIYSPTHGRILKAHRVAYELFVGPIPAGLHIDHLCRNRACVRPDHLEPVTAKENLLRGIGLTARNAAVTHCPKGHEYTELNTRWVISNRRRVKAPPRQNSVRQCRACDREKKRALRQTAEGRERLLAISRSRWERNKDRYNEARRRH